jgi:hypothetical protein
MMSNNKGKCSSSRSKGLGKRAPICALAASATLAKDYLFVFLSWQKQKFRGELF